MSPASPEPTRTPGPAVEVRWTEPAPRLRIVVTRAAGCSSTQPPVLMLHGLWHAGWAWENWSSTLAAHGYDCYAVDFRGHGASEGDLREARLGHYLEDARRAVADLPSAPILIGHSLGATLVEHLLAEATYPAAVLVAGVPGRYPIGTVVRTSLNHPVATLRSVVRRDLAPLVGTPEAARRFLFSAGTNPGVVRRTQTQLTSASPRVVRDLVLAPKAKPLRSTPTLVLAGTRDAAFRPRAQRRRARKIGADYRQVEGSGHDVPLDHRWREAVDSAAAWLEVRAVRR